MAAKREEEHEDEGLPSLEALSLEERLRHVREGCRLFADLFAIQAELAFLASQVVLSADAYNFLSCCCQSSADDLERLVRELPPDIANWHGAGGKNSIDDE